MILAVIKTGGKQYIVKPGQKMKVEKLEGEVGAKITLNNVLLIVDGEKVDIGQPEVNGASVEAKIIKQGRARKVIVYKFKPKKRERKKKGHRQHFTELEIVNIKSK